MASGYRNAPRKQASTRALLLVSILVIVLLALNAISRGALAARVRSFSSAAGSAIDEVIGTVVHNGYFSSHSSLERDNESLKQQVADLQDELAGTASLRQENQQLQDLTHVAQSEPGAAVVVLSSFGSSPYGTFMISTQKQEIALNDLVEDGGGFVIGKVAQVGAGTALVTEIFAPNTSTEALVDGIAATVDGLGGGNARMQIPETQSSSVAIGDVVVAPSLGGRSVGVVGKISSDPSDAYATLYISLPVNIDSLGYVYVVQQ